MDVEEVIKLIIPITLSEFKVEYPIKQKIILANISTQQVSHTS